MAKKRLLAPWVGEERRSAIYHTISRTVHRGFLLKDAEKEHFVKLMRLYEEFCGVRVLSFCVMSNHFHILVEIPPSMEESLTDEALLERLRLIYKDDYVAVIRMQLDELARSETEAGKLAYAKLREKFTCRMWDLGRFMQSLKQGFTFWYNARHGLRGTLWEARYKSVLVEDGHAARVMAAYIDLNPIRAAMVKKPEDYRWCSYAEAVAGGKRGALARKGIARVFEERENQGDSDSAYDGWEHFPTPERYGWRSIAGRYRVILFEDGEEKGLALPQGRPQGLAHPSGRPQELALPQGRSQGLATRVSSSNDGKRSKRRKGFSAEEVEREVNNEGRLGLGAILECKTRSLVDGGVIGGKEFVQGVVEQLKGGYLRADRKSGANKLPGQGRKKREKGSSLWSMRRIPLE